MSPFRNPWFWLLDYKMLSICLISHISCLLSFFGHCVLFQEYGWFWYYILLMLLLLLKIIAVKYLNLDGFDK